MNTLNVLHIASFNGNVGDNANHNGLYNNLNELFNQNIVFDQLEMREFYLSWNLRNFNDESFIKLCNDYDLIIIGGGNFFELKWDYSYTGTTINLSEDTLNKISCPILFFGLGCDIGKGVNSKTISRFKHFLDKVINSDKYMVTVRNDGSLETLTQLYGDRFNGKIKKVADGAFFINTDNINLPNPNHNRKVIGINVACDMKEIRFNNQYTYGEFVIDFAELLNKFLLNHEGYNLIFFPHIYSDIEAISDVINNIEDKYRRIRVSVAPYLNGQGSERYLFALYNTCTIILGMRFHANVCAVSQNIPTIALCSYKKITDLYNELGMVNRVVNVNEKGFKEILENKIIETLNELPEVVSKYEDINRKIKLENDKFLDDFNEWIINNKMEEE